MAIGKAVSVKSKRKAVMKNCHCRNFTKSISKSIPDNQVISTLQAINDDWRLDAKQEDAHYFCMIDEIEDIKFGKKCFIIGRKGMGKTAIAEYLFANQSPSVFSERLTFKNFPFNILYDKKDETYTQPNQYITIWKYLICNAICKLMAKNENLPSSLHCVLRKIYPTDSMEGLNRLIPKWTAKGFGLDLLNVGCSIEGDEKPSTCDSWIEKLQILQSVIEQYADGAYYYILLDELDEDYREFGTEEERRLYLSLITSLFKAVQSIKSDFRFLSANFRPVVFLRSDIYDLIRDSDKNKWSDYKIDLTWRPEKILKMLGHRISISSNGVFSPDESWDAIFSSNPVSMGNGGHNRMNSFDYITRSTHWRPRDYIQYVANCARQSLQKGIVKISPTIIKEVDREFSEYLKGEIIDEVFAIIPNIDDIFRIISHIRKQTFPPKIFIDAYKEYGRSEMEARDVLLKLFEYGVIGNRPSMRGQQIFKHQHPNSLFNFRETIIIHRGLYKALQIF